MKPRFCRQPALWLHPFEAQQGATALHRDGLKANHAQIRGTVPVFRLNLDREFAGSFVRLQKLTRLIRSMTPFSPNLLIDGCEVASKQDAISIFLPSSPFSGWIPFFTLAVQNLFVVSIQIKGLNACNAAIFIFPTFLHAVRMADYLHLNRDTRAECYCDAKSHGGHHYFDFLHLF
ncbi:MAG: hypothetical protein WCN98_09535 [Verrucomicrobiaceae bacterium]